MQTKIFCSKILFAVSSSYSSCYKKLCIVLIVKSYVFFSLLKAMSGSELYITINVFGKENETKNCIVFVSVSVFAFIIS